LTLDTLQWGLLDTTSTNKVLRKEEIMTRGSAGGMLKPSKMAPTIWQTIDSKYQTRCKKCGKRIWKFWKAPTKEEKLLKGFKEKVMDLCANHYFKRIK
jgi:hypothetical protein